MNNNSVITIDDKTQKKHTIVLVISLILAIVSAQVLVDTRFGLNFVFICIAGIVAMYFLRKHFQQDISKNELLLISSAMIFCLCLTMRQSEVIYWLNLLAIHLTMWIAFAKRYTGSLYNIPMISWLMTPFRLAYLCLFSAKKLFSLGFSTAAFNSKQNQLVSVFMGVLWAIPVLFILGYLLISSDSRFENFMINIFSFDFNSILKHTFNTLFYFPFISAFFYVTTLGYCLKKHKNKNYHYTLEGIQILTIMILVNLLFISYIIIQISYFFGGNQLVLESNSLTYSSYARKGFWELIILSMIVIPLLLIFHWLQRNESPALQQSFKILAVLMVMCLIIIEFSAIYRMQLYVSMYSLTELRFYSSIFMLYMMGGLIIFCLTVLRNQPGKFIMTMVVQAIIFIFVLNLINPDAQISQYNISHYNNKTTDIHYLKKLSVDAYPTIYNNKHSLTNIASCLLQSQLSYKLKKLKKKEHQWNWSIYKADRIIEQWKYQCQKTRQ